MKNQKMEKWKNGKNGKMKKWKNVTMETWKTGKKLQNNCKHRHITKLDN